MVNEDSFKKDFDRFSKKTVTARGKNKNYDAER